MIAAAGDTNRNFNGGIGTRTHYLVGTVAASPQPAISDPRVAR